MTPIGLQKFPHVHAYDYDTHSMQIHCSVLVGSQLILQSR